MVKEVNMDTSSTIKRLLGEYEKIRTENQREGQRREREIRQGFPAIAVLLDERRDRLTDSIRAALQGRAVDAERMQLHACAVEAVTAALILYAAFTLLLAVWVFRDARRRDFLPAMWGLLTLIGNVVAWLVYMLVRSRGVGSRCPRCGTALRMGFAYCPACGAQVRRSCPACGHAAEDGWKVCPYCGRELPAPPAGNAV